VCDWSGWPAVTEPSTVVNQPNGRSLSGAGVNGPETKRTDTLNLAPRLIGRCGVITSSWPRRSKPAPRPFTRTEPTESPEKSRSKLASACVERASIVTFPETSCSGALDG
jgi:hypothetical protein